MGFLTSVATALKEELARQPSTSSSGGSIWRKIADILNRSIARITAPDKQAATGALNDIAERFQFTPRTPEELTTNPGGPVQLPEREPLDIEGIYRRREDLLAQMQQQYGDNLPKFMQNMQRHFEHKQDLLERLREKFGDRFADKFSAEGRMGPLHALQAQAHWLDRWNDRMEKWLSQHPGQVTPPPPTDGGGGVTPPPPDVTPPPPDVTPPPPDIVLPLPPPPDVTPPPPDIVPTPPPPPYIVPPPPDIVPPPPVLPPIDGSNATPPPTEEPVAAFAPTALYSDPTPFYAQTAEPTYSQPSSWEPIAYPTLPPITTAPSPTTTSWTEIPAPSLAPYATALPTATTPTTTTMDPLQQYLSTMQPLNIPTGGTLNFSQPTTQQQLVTYDPVTGMLVLKELANLYNNG